MGLKLTNPRLSRVLFWLSQPVAPKVSFLKSPFAFQKVRSHLLLCKNKLFSIKTKIQYYTEKKVEFAKTTE